MDDEKRIVLRGLQDLTHDVVGWGSLVLVFGMAALVAVASVAAILSVP